MPTFQTLSTTQRATGDIHDGSVGSLFDERVAHSHSMALVSRINICSIS